MTSAAICFLVGLGRFLRAFIWCAAMFAIVVYASGCNSLPPPASIHLEADASEVLAEAVWTARDAWCAADVGWCPDVFPGGEARIYVTTWDGAGHELNPAAESFEEAGWTGPAGNETAWEVKVPPPFATAQDLSWILVHEFGHFCIDGHTREGIMQAAPAYRPEPVVDETARAAWLRDCPR